MKSAFISFSIIFSLESYFCFLAYSFGLLQGKKIKCSTSQAKNKLFIGNVPRNWGEEDMKSVVTEIGPGVNCIELLKVCALVHMLSITSQFKRPIYCNGPLLMCRFILVIDSMCLT